MFFAYLLSPGQFPSTFVEEVTIPSTKPGDRLYVCINDFSTAEQGNLSLKRGKDTLLTDDGDEEMTEVLIVSFYNSLSLNMTFIGAHMKEVKYDC